AVCVYAAGAQQGGCAHRSLLDRLRGWELATVLAAGGSRPGRPRVMRRWAGDLDPRDRPAAPASDGARLPRRVGGGGGGPVRDAVLSEGVRPLDGASMDRADAGSVRTRRIRV